MAVAEIVKMIEQERTSAAMVVGYLKQPTHTASEYIHDSTLPVVDGDSA